ncbi:MAG: CpsD/CapB family tyrosine-protein kinase [Clostridiales bacterium]|nr:CpsD/CapB family tyrosine-protein kinase [Clostridiales bacterium]
MSFFKKKNKSDKDYKILVNKNGNNNNERLEGYNRLKDNVLYMNTDGKTKVFQIESSIEAEGKTTVACNLAVCLALVNKKVVVVDLDFHRPRVHRLFNMSKDNGIAEYFLDHAGKENIIKKTKYQNVDIITRGSEIHNASLVLVSDKFKSLIADLRKKYDYVLLDCPPVLQVSDFIHISKVSDGVLFMVAYASTSRKQVAEAVKELKNNGANILGTVFTMYDKKKDKDYTGYGSYYKGRYYEKDIEDQNQEEYEEVEEQDGIDESIKRDVELILQNMSEDGVEYVVEKIIEEESDS